MGTFLFASMSGENAIPRLGVIARYGMCVPACVHACVRAYYACMHACMRIRRACVCVILSRVRAMRVPVRSAMQCARACERERDAERIIMVGTFPNAISR